MRHTRRMKIAAILGVRIGTAVAFGGPMRSRWVEGMTRALSITLALGACGGKTAGSPIAASDTAACMIVASNYDQSCEVDTDCSTVSVGDYCVAGCLCDVSAISKTALAQFQADVAKTPVGSGAVQELPCSCPGQFGLCCRQGQCVTGSECLAATDAGP